MTHQNKAIQKLLEDRYYLRDKKGNLLESTPTQIFDRVARTVAVAEELYTDNPVTLGSWYSKFYQLMYENKFLPNTPLLINAGKDAGTYSGCFYLDVEDSMESIFDTVKKAAIISKGGGGVGFNFSNLREKGAIVKSTGHKASGPVSFMQVFNTMCDTISQGGVRRGAMIALLNIDHPDIEEFICCKDDGASFTNFNISVAVTDEFMECLGEDDGWDLYSPKGEQLDPVKSVKAGDLWNLICEHAWKTGEPGVVFIDHMKKDDPEINGCNPCGEIGLRNAESCNLGSINLIAYVKSTQVSAYDKEDKKIWFDFDELKKDIPTMVRFLDDVIDVNHFPTPEIEEATKKTRKLGLGVMGWADTLIKLNIPYDSDAAIELAEKIIYEIFVQANTYSDKLGIEKGTYPDNKHGEGGMRRNMTLLCVAPTGTISRIAGVSSGIEPVFAWKTHHKLADMEYDERHWALDDFSVWPEGEEFPSHMKTASEIAPEWHLKHQATFQKYIDNSVSKTINLPNEYKMEDINEIFLEAYNSGCKGITVYRDGSRDNQPLTDNTKDRKEDFGESEIETINYVQQKINLEKTYRNRGAVAMGSTHKIKTPKGKVYVTINYARTQPEPIEIFIRLGYTATPNELNLADWCARMISLCLKHNVPLEKIIKQSEKIFGDSSFIYMGRLWTSLPQCIGHLLGFSWQQTLDMIGLEDTYEDDDLDWEVTTTQGESVVYVTPSLETVSVYEHCYVCGQDKVVREAGCKVCTNCGDEAC